MNYEFAFRRLRLQMMAACACIAVCGCFGHAESRAAVMLGNMKADKILFLGNSITTHPPAPFWYGDNWGMAASSLEKDYVHVLTSSIAGVAGGMPSIMAANLADFERGYTTYDLGVNLQTQLAFQPDIVVVAIGENVASLDTAQSQAAYGAAYANLLTLLKNNGNPTIFARGTFWANPTKDSIMQQATVAAGGVFVDMSSLCQNPLNFAYSEDLYRYNGTVNTHPGDAGMAAIAGRLFDSMVTHSVPEPSSLVLLVIAGSSFGGLIWRRRTSR